MATSITTISVKAEALRLLKRFQQPGQSYSDVIIEHFQGRRRPAQTAGELLDRLESFPPPAIDAVRFRAWRAGRGRRSHRKP